MLQLFLVVLVLIIRLYSRCGAVWNKVAKIGIRTAPIPILKIGVKFHQNSANRCEFPEFRTAVQIP